jgi:hypothetical protein
MRLSTLPNVAYEAFTVLDMVAVGGRFTAPDAAVLTNLRAQLEQAAAQLGANAVVGVQVQLGATSNNARTSNIVNAIQLQMLLAQPPGKGAPLPDVIEAALAQPPTTESADGPGSSDAG